MGRNNKKGGSAKPAPANNSSTAAPSASATSTPRDPEPEPPSPAAQPENGESLQAQLAAKDSEIALLKEALAQRDAEILALKRGGGQSDGATKASSSEDIEKLQERLAQLKREQMEADAARDAAWRQLKSVVQEIAKLVPPEPNKVPTSA